MHRPPLAPCGRESCRLCDTRGPRCLYEAVVTVYAMDYFGFPRDLSAVYVDPVPRITSFVCRCCCRRSRSQRTPEIHAGTTLLHAGAAAHADHDGTAVEVGAVDDVAAAGAVAEPLRVRRRRRRFSNFNCSSVEAGSKRVARCGSTAYDSSPLLGSRPRSGRVIFESPSTRRR